MRTVAFFVLMAVSTTAANATCRRDPASYDLPAQRLDAAVRKLSQMTGCNVAFDPAMVADRRTGPLKGRLTPEQALAKLVRGTGYAARATPTGLTFDGSVLDVTMSQARVLRTTLDAKAKSRIITSARAVELQAILNSVERSLPRIVNSQGSVTRSQKQDVIRKLDSVRAAVGPVPDARDWASFKHDAA